MTTIYAVYNSDGCVGKCDAKCHEAKEPECDCICGGRFHGKGHLVAVNGRSKFSDEQILEQCKRLGLTGELKVKRHQEQLTLFD